MGKLVSSTLPNLITGVSQQPWNVRLNTQAEEQINCYCTLSDFLKRRPSFSHITKLSGVVGQCKTHVINRDETEKYICLFSEQGVKIHTLDGIQKSVSVTSSAQSYLNQSSNYDKDLRFLTINDYTFVLNTAVQVQKLGDKTPKRTPEALVFIKQASYNTTYSVTLDGRKVSFTTLDGVAPVDEPADELSSTQIIHSLTSQLNNGNYHLHAESSTLWIRRVDGKDFTLTVEDSRSNTHITAFKDRVQRFSDLPTVAPTGFTVEILGDNSSSFDNYYCKFTTIEDNVSFGDGVWTETVCPDVEYRLAPSTMPHAIIRKADGTFSFEPITWGNRLIGDDLNSPFPSFVGRKLNDLFFYRNRLSFLSEENVIMSETGEFFNFFHTTATTLVDSDVIDVAASHTRSASLTHAIEYTGGLLLFSGQSQFLLEHDTVLSVTTVSVRPVTEFEASTVTPPVSAGKTVFFATDKGGFGGVREYMSLGDTSDQNDAVDITAHVPYYIKGNIRTLTCSTNEDILLALTDEDKSNVYVYKYFWNGAEKIQSAWSKWQMQDDVIAFYFIGTSLYMVIEHQGEGIFLEKADVSSGYKDIESDYEYYLDRKITEETVTVTYDITSNHSSITLPYKADPSYVIVSRGTENSNRTFEITAVSDNVIEVKGNVRHIPLYIGKPFLSSYTFTTFALREDTKGNAITEGRLQLRKLSLNCIDTAFLNIHITPLFRETNTYVFTGREIGQGENKLNRLPLYTGTLSYPILSINTQVEIKVSSESYLPFTLVNASWEGFYNTRNRNY